MNNSKYWKLGGLLVVLLGLIAALGTAVTFAQDDATEPDVTVPETPADPGNGRPDGPRDRGEGGPFADSAIIQSAIADALGISVEDLAAAQADGVRLPDLAAEQGVDMQTVQDAINAVMPDAVATAVADGTITQEQADSILERLAAMEARAATQESYLDNFSGELGVTVDELEAARATALQQLVDEGLITQEQADQMLSRPSSFGGPGAGRPGGHGGPGGQGGPGGHGGHGGPRGGADFGGQNGAPENAPVTPSNDA